MPPRDPTEVHTDIVGLLCRWTLSFLLLEAFAEKPWASKAYGLQTYLLGNTGAMTHEIWAAFDNPVQALTFLEMFPQTEEWQAYSAETRDAVSLVRSYMALTAVSLNED